ncbi:MAG: Rne/Rng family ribonuclease [Clostridia bacterium]
MPGEIIVNVTPREIRLALMQNGELQEIYFENADHHRIAGNIYKGKVTNVLPGMQAAFVDIGLEKNAYLYVTNALTMNTVINGVRKKRNKRKKINQLLHPNQDVIVQITKEPIGTKGARVNSKISLPGRYLVLTPLEKKIGVSQRIKDSKERARLRKIGDKISKKDVGLIIRTAAEGISEHKIRQDYTFLINLWKKIKIKAVKTKAPVLLHEDADLIFRAVRDLFDGDIENFHVDNREVYQRVVSIVKDLAPEAKDNIHLYKKKRNIFDVFGVESEINKALKRKVWLKCGGHLIIDRTEAMTVIDVNTGKYVGKNDLSDTVLKTNLEAAEEVARQLRLRDIGGIIIVDFIDMTTRKNQTKVIEALEEAFLKDRAKPTVLDITKLGLIEITRKKVSSGLSDIMQKECPYCEGTGRVVSEEAIGTYLENEIKNYFRTYTPEAILIEVNPLVAAVLIGSGGSNLQRLEREVGGTIYVRGAENRHVSEWKIVSSGTSESVQAKALPVNKGDVLTILVEEKHQSNENIGIARVNGYVLQIPNAGDQVGERVRIEIEETHRTYAITKII